MHVFTDDAAEVFPGIAQGCLDPGRISAGERGAQVDLADPVRWQERAEAACDGAAEI
jgi:hypothetical protein